MEQPTRRPRQKKKMIYKKWPASAWQIHFQENASENWAIQRKQKWGQKKNIWQKYQKTFIKKHK